MNKIMAMAVGGPKKGRSAVINMTPMIDILLVLLIVFHGDHAPDAARPGSFHAGTPDKKNQPPPRSGPHRGDQQIDKDKKLKINREGPMTASSALVWEQIFKTRAERVVFVKGDPDLDVANRGAPWISPRARPWTRSVS